MKVVFTHKNGRKQTMSRRDADILQKLKRGTYAARDIQAQAHRDDEELSRLRAEYQDVVGKRAFHGWDAEQLREKISGASQGGE